MALISLKNTNFKYNLSSNKALENINLDIFEGDKILIIGKTGASKSTLLQMFKQSVYPKGDLENPPVFYIKDEEISYVPQKVYATFLSKNVVSNIVFTAENLSIPKDEIERRLSEICTYLAITHILDKNVDELSGGEKILVAIACAIITYPKVLILDEPLTELSVDARKKIINILDLLHEETNMTIIISEHQVNDCTDFTDKIGLLESGKLTLFDKKDIVLKQLFNSYENFLFLPDVPKLSIKLKNKVFYTPFEFKNNISLSKVETLKFEEKEFQDKVITLRKIKYFYENKNKCIFENLSLNIHYREKIAILGANGAGKTTLLKLIAKINKAFDGKIKIENKNIKYLPQDIHSYFTKETVKEELEKYSDNLSNEKIVKLFDLEKIFLSSPYDLSSGEALLVCICSVILSKCDILLLDEPTKNLDVFSKKIFGEFLKTSDLTVVMATHDLDFCANYLDNCAFIFNKKISTVKNAKKFMLDNTLFTTSIKKATKHCTTYDEAIKLWD